VALATARAGNVIGGGDWAKDRLIPDILDAFAAGRAVQIRNPHATRPWQHVLEPLRGYLTLAQRLVEGGPAFGEGWNFGPHSDDARPVEWIVRQLATRWGTGAHWQVDAGEHPHEATYLKLDISKAAQRLPWRPVLRLDDALGLIVDWSRAKMAGADMRAQTLAQIAAYQDRAERALTD
jgi:CDP-glucose 4,6-dehydratase